MTRVGGHWCIAGHIPNICFHCPWQPSTSICQDWLCKIGSEGGSYIHRNGWGSLGQQLYGHTILVGWGPSVQRFPNQSQGHRQKHLLWGRGLQVCITNVNGKDIDVVQCSIGKSNVDALSWYYTCIGGTVRVSWHVSIEHPLCLPCKIRLHLEDKVFSNMTPTNWYIGIGSRILKAMPTLCIFFSSAFLQKLLPFFASIS